MSRLARLLLMLAAMAGVSAAEARSLAEIRASRQLVIGTSGSAAPYSWVDDHNRLTGYDIDLGNEIGRALGLPVVWRKIDFRGLMPALSTGQLDLVMSAVRIQPRMKGSFLFSDPYSYEATVAVTRMEETGIRRLQDIRGRTVAAVASSFQEDVARRTGGYRDLLLFPNGTDIFLALHTRHADVGIVGITAARHYAKVGGDPIRIVTAGAPLAAQGIVIDRQSPELKIAIDRLLAARRADGRYAALYRKHFGSAPPR